MTKTAAAALAAALLLCSCGGDEARRRDSSRRAVVAVTSAPAAWLVELSGGALPAEVVASAGADPRRWRPDDAALEALVSAERVLLVSEEFEPWTQRAGLPPSRTLELADLVEPDLLLRTTGVEHTHGTGPAHSHGGTVGTIWTDPAALETLPARVAEALGGSGDGLRAPEGLDAYREALTALGAKAAGRAIIATDHGLEYVARAAGVEVRVALLECGPDGPTNQRGILQAEAFAKKEDDAGLLVWVGEAPHSTFAPAAEAEFGLRSIPFDLGAAPGSDVLGALTASVRALTEAL